MDTLDRRFLSERPALQNYFDGSVSTEDGAKFSIHRVLLSTESAAFHSLFLAQDPDITLARISRSTVKNVLSFIYTGRAPLNSTNIVATLLAADDLQVKKLKKYCQAAIAKNTKIQNCIPIFVACSERSMDIKGELYRFIQIHFEEVIKKSPDDVCSLTAESLGKFLGDASVNVYSEKTIWEAITLWVKNSERYAAAPSLMSNLISGKINEHLSNEIISHPTFKEIIQNTLLLTHPGLSNREYLERCVRSSQRSSSQIIESRLPASLNFVAKYSSNAEEIKLELFQTYDQQMDVWMKIGQKELADIRRFDYLVRMGNCLFVIDSLETYSLGFDILERRWIDVESLNYSQSRCCVVETGGRIYVLGDKFDSDGVEDGPVPFAEHYDQVELEWVRVRPFHSMILEDAVGLGGRIYAFGIKAHGVENNTMMAQMYLPETDVWMPIRPPNLTRTRFCAVATASSVWLIGGQRGASLGCVEEYDTVGQQWRERPDLPLSYWAPRAVQVCGKIYVYDEYDEDSKYRSMQPVCWDSELENWTKIDASSPMHKVGRYLYCNVSDRVTMMEITAGNRRRGCQWECSPFAKQY